MPVAAVVCDGEGCSDDEGERGESGEAVVLLAGGEGEEAEDDGDPEEEREGRLTVTPEAAIADCCL